MLQPMPQIDHNAPRFSYRVSWKRDIPDEPWIENEVLDWKIGRLEIPNQPTFQQYRIRVVATNEKGESNVVAKEVVGYSGEDGRFSLYKLFAGVTNFWLITNWSY
jgi:neuronal cell adhesion protein